MLLPPFRDQPIPYRVLIVLFIWMLAAGLSWADQLDLSDDMTGPHAELQQVLESEENEIADEFHAAILVGDARRERDGIVFHALTRLRGNDRGPVSLSTLPLYSRFSTYRI